MKKINIKEGYMPFKGYKTYYRTVGENSGAKKAVIFLHGGPGSTHNYFEVLDSLADDGRMLVMYDQLGCGNSFINSHEELWNAETWLDELEALRKHLNLDEVHIVGQSWGGMQIIQYMIERKPKGVKSIIISSGHPSSSMWEAEQRKRLKFLPVEMQEAIEKAESIGDYDNPKYLQAVDMFMERHAANKITADSPECLRRKKIAGKEAYITAWGHSEFAPSGNLKDFEYVDRLHEIKVPSLIVNGEEDLCSPVIAKCMYDNIPNSEWEMYMYAKHMCFVDENEKYIELARNWFNKYD